MYSPRFYWELPHRARRRLGRYVAGAFCAQSSEQLGRAPVVHAKQGYQRIIVHRCRYPDSQKRRRFKGESLGFEASPLVCKIGLLPIRERKRVGDVEEAKTVASERDRCTSYPTVERLCTASLKRPDDATARCPDPGAEAATWWGLPPPHQHPIYQDPSVGAVRWVHGWPVLWMSICSLPGLP